MNRKTRLWSLHFGVLIADAVTAKKTLQIGVLLALVVFAALFVLAITRVLLLVFAGILIAVFLHGCGDWLARRLGWKYGWSLSVTILGLAIFFALCGWFVAPRVQAQWSEFEASLPAQIDQLKRLGTDSQWADTIRGAAQSLFAEFKPFQKVSDWVIDLVVIFFVSVYLAAQPALYRGGLLALVPPRRRPAFAAALDRIETTLWRWFIGRLVGMAVIGILVFIAMASIGVPLAFTLGLVAGVFEFVPYVGAIVSSVPAILLALPRGAETVWLVILLYLIVHGIDGYIVIPLVERQAVRIPPALTIAVQVCLYLTAGFVGVLIADPLAACALVLLKRFYLNRQVEA